MKPYLVTIVVGMTALMTLGCRDESQAKQTVAPAPKVEVATLEATPKTLTADFSAKTSAYDAARIVARVHGELLKVAYRPGARIKQGDLLFRIDPSEYDARVQRAEALLRKDKAAYALAKADVARYEPLVAEKLAPKAKLDQLRTALRELEATLKADEAALKEAKLIRSYCDVKATVAGKAGKPAYLPGNLIKEGDVLTRIIDEARLYVNFFPSSYDATLIKRYAKTPLPPVEVYLRGDKSTPVVLKGAMEFIDNAADAQSDTVAMRAVVENPDKLVLPGSFVTARVILGEYPVIAVDPSWIGIDQQGEYVYRVDSNNTLHAVHFGIKYRNDRFVVPDEKLKAGMRVVTKLYPTLHEGMRITPVPADTTKGAQR